MTTESRLAEARKLLDEHDYDGAVEHLRPVLEANPQTLSALKVCSEAMLAKGDIDAAFPFAERLAILSTGDSDAHFLYGYVLERKHRLGDAIFHFESALQFHPSHTNTRRVMEGVLVEHAKEIGLNDPKAAIPFLERAVHLNPMNAIATAALLEAVSHTNDQIKFEEIVRLIPPAIQSDPLVAPHLEARNKSMNHGPHNQMAVVNAFAQADSGGSGQDEPFEKPANPLYVGIGIFALMVVLGFLFFLMTRPKAPAPAKAEASLPVIARTA